MRDITDSLRTGQYRQELKERLTILLIGW